MREARTKLEPNQNQDLVQVVLVLCASLEPNFGIPTAHVVLSSDFGWRTLGPKLGEALTSTYGLCHSLDGLP